MLHSSDVSVHSSGRATSLSLCTRSNCRIFAVIALVMLGLTAEKTEAQSVNFTSSNLPIVVIETDGIEIPDEPKVPARMGIIRNAEGRNYIDSAFTDFSGPIAIELRGNSSQMYEQKQYLFKTLDSAGSEANVSLMDLPAEHEWILYGPYVDKSLMRNVLAYRLANDMGWYASRTRLCELLLDGEYRGVYVLMENIKRDKNRVNIAKLGADIVTGQPLTGGYILAIDHNTKAGEKGFAGANDSAGYFVYWYVYPSPSNIVVQQEWYIQNYIRSFEDLMRHPAFNEPIRGYTSFLDVASFVDYILINEWANNVDGFVASVYLHKDRQSIAGKLVAGPVWDFNIAFGNADYSDSQLTSGWRMHYGRVPFWWRRLLQDPAFVDRLESRWRELRTSTMKDERLEALIDSLASRLDEAQQRHFQRWSLLGQKIWPNAFVGETFAEELGYLRQWLQSRAVWMDGNLRTIALQDETGGTTLVQTDSSPAPITLSVHPLPSRGTVTVRYSLPQAGFAQVVLRDMLGREVRRSVLDERNAGSHVLSFNLHELPNGLYQAVLIHNGTSVLSTNIVLVK